MPDLPLVKSQENRQDGVAVLSLQGGWGKGNNDGFRAAASNLVRSGASRIVLDLTEVSSIDSYALASLFAAYARVKAMQPPGSFCLVGANPDLRDEMEKRLVARLIPDYFDLATGIAAVKREGT